VPWPHLPTVEGCSSRQGKKSRRKKRENRNSCFSVGPGFFHYRPNFSAFLNFAGPILKLFVWAVKRRPKTSPTYKIETLTFCSAHIFKTCHPAAATVAAQPLEQASRPAATTAAAQPRAGKQAIQLRPAARAASRPPSFGQPHEQPAARLVHSRQHRQAAEQLLLIRRQLQCARALSAASTCRPRPLSLGTGRSRPTLRSGMSHLLLQSCNHCWC
jgi:hypothetical protein